jgi:hypothetical protein
MSEIRAQLETRRRDADADTKHLKLDVETMLHVYRAILNDESGVGEMHHTTERWLNDAERSFQLGFMQLERALNKPLGM